MTSNRILRHALYTYPGGPALYSLKPVEQRTRKARPWEGQTVPPRRLALSRPLDSLNVYTHISYRLSLL